MAMVTCVVLGAVYHGVVFDKGGGANGQPRVEASVESDITGVAWVT